MAKEKISLLQTLAAVEESDLQQIDAEIETHEKALAGLREVRRVVFAKLHPEQVKRPGGKPGARRKRSDVAETEESSPAAAPAASNGKPVIATIKNVLEVSGQLTVGSLTRQLKVAGFPDVTEHGVRIALGHAKESITQDSAGRYSLVRH